MPDWARGRMNAVHMMASQGGVALGGVLWGGAATSVGLGPTLVGGALLLTASLALAIPLSINFAHSLNLEPAPWTARIFVDTKTGRRTRHGHAGASHSSGRPARIPQVGQTASVDLFAQRRFSFPRRREPRTSRHFPNRNALSSWAEHLRQFARMTKAETEHVERAWGMHAGDEEPVVRHYLPANRLWTPLGFSRFQKQPDPGFAQRTRLLE